MVAHYHTSFGVGDTYGTLERLVSEDTRHLYFGTVAFVRT
jgi:hypothetical protein